MTLIDFVEEQSVFSFTGRVKIKNLESPLFSANLFLLQGRVVSANRLDLTGKKALYSIIVETLSRPEIYRYMAEPEVVLDEQIHFSYTGKIFRNLAEDSFFKYKQSLKLRPPANLSLAINPQFILEGGVLTPEEFDLLKTLSDYSVVEEIYQKTDLLEHEVTQGMIELRKKGAIKVLG